MVRIFDEGNVCAAFQDVQFVSPVTFEDDGCAGNSDAHATGSNATAPGVFWNAKKHGATFDLGVVTSLVETEDRVRT